MRKGYIHFLLLLVLLIFSCKKTKTLSENDIYLPPKLMSDKLKEEIIKDGKNILERLKSTEGKDKEIFKNFKYSSLTLDEFLEKVKEINLNISKAKIESVRIKDFTPKTKNLSPKFQNEITTKSEIDSLRLSITFSLQDEDCSAEGEILIMGEYDKGDKGQEDEIKEPDLKIKGIRPYDIILRCGIIGDEKPDGEILINGEKFEKDKVFVVGKGEEITIRKEKGDIALDFNFKEIWGPHGEPTKEEIKLLMEKVEKQRKEGKKIKYVFDEIKEIKWKAPYEEGEYFIGISFQDKRKPLKQIISDGIPIGIVDGGKRQIAIRYLTAPILVK